MRYADHMGLLRYGEAWFGEPVGEADDLDILLHVQCDEPVDHTRSEPFQTLMIDLERTPDELLASFDKTTRYEVRRALGRDEVKTSWESEVTRKSLQRFVTDYDAFARSRGLDPVATKRLEAIRAAGALVLSRAELDDAVKVWHAYIHVGGRIRLLLSSTADRSVTKDQKALIGRSNRALHYADALAAQKAGVRWLDLGGWSGQKEGHRRSIDAFKEGFGGRVVAGWNATEARSVRGRLALGAADARSWLLRVRGSR
ncbi:MAG: hypothetical protein AVDCRST_MAG76-1243 [uncultured Acidimicrobiales bacterium]|uniref:BioF2-like acetyltransferase domain-containing protein n=1 Tax=uncultured Acidimicrobiales bacterium TaxID=310071 RepID=A0A6J4HRV9_9ACTN|nr:MAG: hypothetical protein AVDCRST_MAG76-1243 [uncultured Acidimicrobiales bacterium]